jgi:nucleoside-diphosphate-sugar epimerase
MHALIIGGASFIGSHLAEAPLEWGWQRRKEEVSRDRPRNKLVEAEDGRVIEIQDTPCVVSPALP